ncbi:MAG: ZIP family metal transporter, partial [Patescibacteria group bacterium]
SALSSVLGVIVVLLLGQMSETLSIWLIPFAAGGFIYIALSDLIPELHKKSDKKIYFFIQIVMIVVGVLAMFLLTTLE